MDATKDIKTAFANLDRAIKNPLVAVQVWNDKTKKVESKVTFAANHTGIARTLDTNSKVIVGR